MSTIILHIQFSKFPTITKDIYTLLNQVHKDSMVLMKIPTISKSSSGHNGYTTTLHLYYNTTECSENNTTYSD